MFLSCSNEINIFPRENFPGISLIRRIEILNIYKKKLLTQLLLERSE